MTKTYKRGPWAEHGRVMPGKRIKPKFIDQILDDGQIITSHSDQVFKPNEIRKVLCQCFPDCQTNGTRLFLSPLTTSGHGVSFYTRNITFLGGDWGPDKKRIQIGNDFLSVYHNNREKNIETVLLGIYHYYPYHSNGVILFVCFSSSTYVNNKANNSAAHIHTIDLLNALKNGVYRRIDGAGNELLVLNRDNFIQHINGLRGVNEVEAIQKDREVLAYLNKIFNSMPKRLVGIECFKEMMEAKDKTRMNQGPWEGFYPEFFIERYLKTHPTDNILWWSKKKKGELDFDLRFPYRDWFYGDVKSDSENKDVQGNVKDNVDILVLEKGGRLWYVAIDFTPERDADHGYVTTKWWNKQLGKVDDPMSYHKRMKHSITLKGMGIYEITKDTIPFLKIYYPPPCSGRDRRPKYKIPHKMKEFLRIFECDHIGPCLTVSSDV